MGRASAVLGGLSIVLLAASLYLIFLWVPTEATMGIVQRAFYFHVPVAWTSFLAFFLVFIGSLGYLWKRRQGMDTLAYASAELGVLLCSLTLITGVIWAKPIWGVWWVWDPRLTTTLILWLIYVAYLMVRAYSPEGSANRFAAVVGIIGFFDVPIVYFSIYWWRTIHPQPLIGPNMGLVPSMILTLNISVVAFTVLFIYLLIQRIRLKNMALELASLKAVYLEPSAEIYKPPLQER